MFMYEHELCVQWSKFIDNENIYYFLRSQKAQIMITKAFTSLKSSKIAWTYFLYSP